MLVTIGAEDASDAEPAYVRMDSGAREGSDLSTFRRAFSHTLEVLSLLRVVSHYSWLAHLRAGIAGHFVDIREWN